MIFHGFHSKFGFYELFFYFTVLIFFVDCSLAHLLVCNCIALFQWYLQVLYCFENGWRMVFVLYHVCSPISFWFWFFISLFLFFRAWFLFFFSSFNFFRLLSLHSVFFCPIHNFPIARLKLLDLSMFFLSLQTSWINKLSSISQLKFLESLDKILKSLKFTLQFQVSKWSEIADCLTFDLFNKCKMEVCLTNAKFPYL